MLLIKNIEASGFCTQPILKQNKTKHNLKQKIEKIKTQTQLYVLFCIITCPRLLLVFTKLVFSFVGESIVLFCIHFPMCQLPYLLVHRGVLCILIFKKIGILFLNTQNRFLWHTDLMYDEPKKVLSQNEQYIKSFLTARYINSN